MQERYTQWLHKNFFENEFRNGIMYISGGTDCALALYLLCEYVEQHNVKDVVLQPCYGWEIKLPDSRKDSYKRINKILDWHRERFSQITINELYIYPVNRDYDTPSKVFDQPVYKLMQHIGRVDSQGTERFVIKGATLSPQGSDWQGAVDISRHDLCEWGWSDWETNKQPDSITVSGVPFVDRNILSSYDKRGIARIYKEKGLLELFKMTRSCHVPMDDGSACKVCLWCSEKYWAFGCYDGEDF